MMDITKIEYHIETSKDGLPTLSIIDEGGKKAYLHSKYSPSKEKDLLNNKFNPDKYDMLIVLGIGLGYHLLPLKEIHGKYRKIILIDAIRDIKGEIEINQSTEFLTQFSKIVFICGISIEEIRPILEELIELEETKGLSILEHPHSIRLFDEYYKDIRKIIDRILTKKAGNKATKRAFGMLYLKNIIKNLSLIRNLYPVQSFFNTMNSYSALVITSGPSLEKHLQSIYENQRQLFIIAVDSSLPVLLAKNIMPDFVISIDPQAFTFEHIINNTLKSTIPVLTLSSHPLIYSNNSSLLSLNTHPFSQLIDELFPEAIGSIDSHTGTVAGDAFNLANHLGFKDIGLLGFDFSFPEYKIYSRGTTYQRRFSLYFQNRFSPIETFNLNYIMKSSRGIKHNNTYTRKSFINYKNSLEEYADKTMANNLYNITTSGIPIKGAQDIFLDDFIEKNCGDDIDKRGMMDNILSESKKIGEIISLIRIQDMLNHRDIFNELIHASLENDINLSRLENIRSLLTSLTL
ncbi:MAG: 6-hydroxymethylpterin diphosphokinase MptE-like protein [Spirochaetota bacterium]|nr:6-hydroxymethylpterin diphosphokinase MptE-like protein [Spirochaetota bacterium]